MVTIYVIKNIVNNKIYVGSTKNFPRRKYKHFNDLKKGVHHSQHLQRSYNKNGKESFYMYKIEECSPEKRDEREFFYISKFKSDSGVFGYNIDIPKNSSFSRSEETKTKMRLSNPNSRKVDLYKTTGEFIKSFNSIGECSLFCDCHKVTISEALRGKRRSFKGFVIVYSGESFKFIPSPKARDMSKFYRPS